MQTIFIGLIIMLVTMGFLAWKMGQLLGDVNTKFVVAIGLAFTIIFYYINWFPIDLTGILILVGIVFLLQGETGQ